MRCPSTFSTSRRGGGGASASSPATASLLGAYFFTVRNVPSHSSPFHANAAFAPSRVANVMMAMPRKRPLSGNVMQSMASTAWPSSAKAATMSSSVL